MEIKERLADSTNYHAGRTEPIEWLVFHYDANDGATDENNGDYFANNEHLNASANYFVDEDSATRTVKDTDTAWHCGATKYVHPYCRNANSLGIEICSEIDENGNYYFTEATLANAIELGRLKMAEYGIDINHCLRHYDVTGKNCPAPFVINPEAWTDFKKRLEVSEMSENTGDNPSYWAVEHTKWAKGKVTNGDGEGNYDWQGTPTKEWIVTVLHNFALAYGLEKE